MHKVEGITPKDDAFHGSKRLSAEWWYFDGVFSDEYSFHIGIRTFSRKKKGRAILFFELYKQDTIIFEKKKRYRFKDLQISKEFPSVHIQQQPIMELDEKEYEKNNKWTYHVTFTIDNCSADLTFSSLTEGFKVETKKESWTVAVPKATVQGTITYPKETLSVNGIGYHDHNWNYTLSTAITYGKGWYWGKIKGKRYNIVWANVLKRSGFQDLLAIVNVDNNGFFPIDPAKIKFITSRFTRYRHRKIPSSFTLSFNDTIKQKKIMATIHMDVDHIHYSKVLLASYWRYHVKVKGEIRIDDSVESIDDLQIMEYLSMI